MATWNLGIECSGQSATVALAEGGRTEIQHRLPSDGGTVQYLALTVQGILCESGIVQPDLISVTAGPGSFTGLRVGLATAKMLSFAWDIPISPVDTLQALALAATGVLEGRGHQGPIGIVPVMNAFRRQVFSGLWVGSADRSLLRCSGTQVVDVLDWQSCPMAALSEGGAKSMDSSTELESQVPLQSIAKWHAFGPGLEQAQPSSASGVQFDILDCVEPTARAVASLGFDAYEAGKVVAAEDLIPNYVRASAAEEVANARRT